MNRTVRAPRRNTMNEMIRQPEEGRSIARQANAARCSFNHPAINRSSALPTIISTTPPRQLPISDTTLSASSSLPFPLHLSPYAPSLLGFRFSAASVSILPARQGQQRRIPAAKICGGSLAKLPNSLLTNFDLRSCNPPRPTLPLPPISTLCCPSARRLVHLDSPIFLEDGRNSFQVHGLSSWSLLFAG